MSRLVIVESPAKAKTIAGYLGAGHTVRACLGHVRDLPKSGLGVDVANGFAPTYELLPGKGKTVADLRRLAREADEVLLATDPDREGEAIAWHLAVALGLPAGKTRRVTFQAITRAAVTAAVRQPRAIDQHLVDAQQARRVLDRLVGYELSPLLWRKVSRGLSAGRVQSVAVRLVVDRDREIEAFRPTEYWTIEGIFQRQQGESRPFTARLHQIKGKPPELPDEATTRRVLAALAEATYSVVAAATAPRRRFPSPPFTTSTLQQEAARKLGLPAKTTMKVAQELYEGVALNGGHEGLITYMRTDSVTVAPEARTAAREVIVRRWGETAVPARPPTYRTKGGHAQEAHEAIRPTDPQREPEALRTALSPAQLRLYRLIWQRFIASQMGPSVSDVTTVDIGARTARTAPGDSPPAIFRATGSVLVDPGFRRVYQGADEPADDEPPLPPLAVADALTVTQLTPEQHFTEPPPFFTEASLIKTLEENGVGRPSTFASIVTTILDRGYVERQNKTALRATALGMGVTDLLVANFPNVLATEFTAGIERRLDAVAAGAQPWVPLVAEFHAPFTVALQAAMAGAERVALPAQPTGESCPQCSQPLVVKKGKHGQFVACSGYPACTFSKPLTAPTGVTCPACKEGELVGRAGKQSGKRFWGCSRYPACQHSEWYEPIAAACSKCGGHLSQITKATRRCLACDGEPPRRFGRATGGGTPRPPSPMTKRVVRKRSAGGGSASGRTTARRSTPRTTSETKA